MSNSRECVLIYSYVKLHIALNMISVYISVHKSRLC
jgi:hypothetical protein